MTPLFVRRRVSRSIALRLAAGLLPSVLAIVLVAVLFYYGQYARQAPHVILILAALLTVVSLIVTWANATYFADRLARLAESTTRTSAATGRTDEFDRIEQVVGSLGSALSASEAERERSNQLAAARLNEQATMLAGVVRDSMAQLDQVRLPLQILLASPFGELNENQEELLRDARSAADVIDGSLRRLGQVADIDRDALPVQRELVQINDVVRSVLPVARATADRRGGRTEVTLEPGLPRVIADRTRLAGALSLLLAGSAANSDANTSLRVSTARVGQRAEIRITPAHTVETRDASASDAEVAPQILASRLIAAQGGDVAVDDGSVTVRIG